jgi:DNA-binding transcriptional LysR family regulator
MYYTLRQLQIFLAVARHSNVSRAAEELSLSQSAISTALSEFERQYDLQLFDRSGKRVQLNNIGAALRPRAEALLAQAEEFELALKGEQALGSLRIGATQTIANYLLPDLMADFFSKHGDIPLQITQGNTAMICAQVLNFELDVALIEGEWSHPDLQIDNWRDDELVIIASPNHPLAKKSSLSEKDLMSAEWIVREKGSGTRQGFEHAMHGILPSIKIRLELEHSEAIKRAVMQGLGLSCLSRIAVLDQLNVGALKILKVPQRDLKRQFYRVQRRGKYRSATMQQWLDFL